MRYWHSLAWVFFRISGGLFNPAVSWSPSDRNRCTITDEIGHYRSDSPSRYYTRPWHSPYRRAMWSGVFCLMAREYHVSYANTFQRSSLIRHHPRSRPLHWGNLYGHVSLYHNHACQGETSCDIHCSNWYRSCNVYWRTCFGQLHRRCFEPCSMVGSCCHHKDIYEQWLDLCCWAFYWCCTCCRVL